MCFLCDLKTSSVTKPGPGQAHGPWQARRAFVLAGAAAAALPAAAQVEVGKASSLRKLVPADTIEKAGSQQFVQTVQEARQKNALLPASHPSARRLQRDCPAHHSAHHRLEPARQSLALGGQR